MVTRSAPASAASSTASAEPSDNQALNKGLPLAILTRIGPPPPACALIASGLAGLGLELFDRLAREILQDMLELTLALVYPFGNQIRLDLAENILIARLLEIRLDDAF